MCARSSNRPLFTPCLRSLGCSLLGSLVGCTQAPVVSEKGPGAATQPVGREATAGAAYEVTVDCELANGSSARVQAVVTTSAAPRPETALDIVFKEFTVPGGEPLWQGVRATLVSKQDDAWPWPWPSVVVSHPDPRMTEDLQAMLNTLSASLCVSPVRPLGPGERWSVNGEFGRSEWQAGAVERQADGEWIEYRHVAHGCEAGAPVTRECTVYEVELRVRVDDRFVGKCVVKDYLITVGGPPNVSTISSKRVQSGRQ